MTELRQDRTSGRWVIVAPQRSKRPGGGRPSGVGVGPQGGHGDPKCPFCPGHETMLPGIVSEVRADASPDWLVRVVPNKFPALTLQNNPQGQHDVDVRDGYGLHEVIVESPRHDADWVSMTGAEIAAIVATYRERSAAAFDCAGIEAVILFRNYGPNSGASLAHPHAQLIALGMSPPVLRGLANWGRAYFSDHGRCPTCDVISAELKDGSRIIDQAPNYLALVPFAAEHPGEVWILPLNHEASFIHEKDDVLPEFGRLLRRVLRRVRSAYDAPSYNFVIDSADRSHQHSAYVHWRLRLVPDLVRWGGFELGAGMPINPSSPEVDARVLREAECDDEDCDL